MLGCARIPEVNGEGLIEAMWELGVAPRGLWSSQHGFLALPIPMASSNPQFCESLLRLELDKVYQVQISAWTKIGGAEICEIQAQT